MPKYYRNAAILLGLLISLMSPFVWAKKNQAKDPYQLAKKQALALYQAHPYTFYCHYPFDHQGRLTSIPATTPLNKPLRLQWEHIVPAQRFAHTLPCWNTPLCRDKKGQAFKGRRCCRLQSPLFQTMESDLHNLVPVLPTLNRARSYYSFTEKLPGPSLLPSCAFRIDKKHHLVAVEPTLLGPIARAYLYMHHTYGLSLSSTEIKTFYQWHSAHPPTAWEHERAQAITQQQGRVNALVASIHPQIPRDSDQSKLQGVRHGYH